MCSLIGAFQGSFVAFIGVPAFVVTLAGYQPLEFTYWLDEGAPEAGRVMRRAGAEGE